MSHLNSSILAFSNNFCLIKNALSGNTAAAKFWLSKNRIQQSELRLYFKWTEANCQTMLPYFLKKGQKLLENAKIEKF